jgi:hypothetical protein
MQLSVSAIDFLASVSLRPASGPLSIRPCGRRSLLEPAQDTVPAGYRSTVMRHLRIYDRHGQPAVGCSQWTMYRTQVGARSFQYGLAIGVASR